jgi:hypothetical protein
VTCPGQVDGGAAEEHDAYIGRGARLREELQAVVGRRVRLRRVNAAHHSMSACWGILPTSCRRWQCILLSGPAQPRCALLPIAQHGKCLGCHAKAEDSTRWSLEVRICASG